MYNLCQFFLVAKNKTRQDLGKRKQQTQKPNHMPQNYKNEVLVSMLADASCYMKETLGLQKHHLRFSQSLCLMGDWVGMRMANVHKLHTLPCPRALFCKYCGFFVVIFQINLSCCLRGMFLRRLPQGCTKTSNKD